MFKQTRTLNLKFICAILFAVTFIVGSFFISALKANAESLTFQIANASSFTMTIYANSVGGVTTVARVGCDPQTGDKYDINTGKICSYTTTSTRIACATGSGDKYDINTGKFCAPLASNVRIGCAAGSIDKYDINIGKLCINPAVVSGTVVFSANGTTSVAPTYKSSDGVTAQVLPDLNIGTGGTVEANPILSNGGLLATQNTETSTTNGTNNDQSASTNVDKANPLTGPLTTRTILLLVILILGIGYGIYSFTRKERYDVPEYVEMKEKKAEAVKPVFQPQAKAPVTPQTPQQPQPQPQPANVPSEPKYQEPRVNTAPQSKIPDTAPLTHTERVVTEQMPLNMPNNPNPQGPTITK